MNTQEATSREERQFESLARLILGWFFHEAGRRKKLADSFQIPAEPDFDSESFAVAPQTILIVDDDSTVLAMMSEMISTFGYRPITVSDGAAALQKAALNRVDLIISDINMPGISGLELLRRVKEEWPGIPVFLMSGDRGALVMAARTSRVDAILSKPFFVEDLNRLVERVLNPLSVVA